MKLKSLLLLLGAMAHFISYGQEYYQYFDGADTSYYNSLLIEFDTSSTNIWQVGPPQKSIFNSASTLPNALVTDTINFYPPNNSSSFSFGIDSEVLTWGILAFQWNQKLDLGINDGGIVEFSLDTGNTWQNAFNNPYVYNFYGFDPQNQVVLEDGTDAFGGTDSTWKDVWFCFDTSWLNYNDSLIVRFTLESDSIDISTDDLNEGWLIDNLMAHITFIHTVNEAELKDYMVVSPNPTTGIVNITTKKIDAFHIIERIELINSAGRLVQEWGVSPTKFFLDISQHPKGMYILKVKTNIQTETFKIILD